MGSVHSGNKQIAKNTVLLFVRTAITMMISLYASRIILSQLGVSDYGVYNAVAGAVTLLSAFSATLSGATQRFITYAIGKDNDHEVSIVFSSSIKVHFILAVLIFIVAEIVGVWFVNTKMNIPEGRLTAANFVFQTALLGFLIDIISLPYNSAIIAYERFGFFAITDIIKSILRLLLISIIYYLPFDSLITYGVIELFIIASLKITYLIYTKTNFSACHISRNNENFGLYKELFRFTGLNLMGTASSVFYTQGSNILLNLFYGVILNAAMGITNQVRSAVNSFVSNFTLAVNPQITKSYAINDYKRTNELVVLGSKMSAYLLMIIGFPIVVNIQFILNLWLVEVPEYTDNFVVLSLLAAFTCSFFSPLNCLLFATGNIKKYQIACVTINVVAIALLYIAFKLQFGPYSIFYIIILQELVRLVVMLLLAQKATGFSIGFFIKEVIIPSIIILCFIIVVYYFLQSCNYSMTLWLFLAESLICIVSLATLIFIIGLNNGERKAMIEYVKKRFRITQ